MTPSSLALQAGLSPAECEAFHLACEGHDSATVAARLGISLAAARMRLCRAGKRLRAERQRQASSAEIDALLDQLEAVIEEGYRELRL